MIAAIRHIQGYIHMHMSLCMNHTSSGLASRKDPRDYTGAGTGTGQVRLERISMNIGSSDAASSERILGAGPPLDVASLVGAVKVVHEISRSGRVMH